MVIKQAISSHISAKLCMLAAALICFGPGVGRPAAAATSLSATLPFDSPEAGDYNGCQLDIYAGTAIVGGSGGGYGNTTKGWAQIFSNDSSGWQYQATLTSDDPNLLSGDGFGQSVSLGQDLGGQTMAVVGAGNDTVYVFYGDGQTWTEDTSARISTTTITPNLFGQDVGISNGRIIVGSGIYGTPANGAAFVYEKSGDQWQETALPASGAKAGFGCSVGICGDNAIVGAPGSSAVYFYNYDAGEWSETARFSATSDFGSSVRICGDYAIAGTPTFETATIFCRDTDTGVWSEEAVLTASDGGANDDEFGWSVDIGENYAIVGAKQANTWCGAAYVFQRDGSTWSEVEKLLPQNSESLWWYEFGHAVAVDESGAGDADFIVTTPNDSDFTGAAYVHDRDSFKQWMPGDADRDDDVDDADAAILAANWLDDDAVDWGDGDFNGDGTVNDADAAMMAANWHFGVDVGGEVPEPSTLVLLALGGLCLLAMARPRR